MEPLDSEAQNATYLHSLPRLPPGKAFLSAPDSSRTSTPISAQLQPPLNFKAGGGVGGPGWAGFSAAGGCPVDRATRESNRAGLFS